MRLIAPQPYCSPTVWLRRRVLTPATGCSEFLCVLFRSTARLMSTISRSELRRLTPLRPAALGYKWITFARSRSTSSFPANDDELLFFDCAQWRGMEDARPGCGSEPVRWGEDIENGTIVLEFRLRCGTGMERVLNGGEIYATRSTGANCVCAVEDKV